MSGELREALEWVDLAVTANDLSGPHTIEMFEVVTAAARAHLDGETVEWCAFHKAAGEPGLDCWGAGINGQDECRMVEAVLTVKGETPA